jgi:uncharacterized protein YjbJ (UPF0337 family)
MNREDTAMNQDRMTGTAGNTGGKVQDGVGRVTRDASSAADGLIDQAADTAQELYGQAKETASDAAHSVRQGAMDATDHIRHAIEKRPYTTAAVALCAGWFIARLARRH